MADVRVEKHGRAGVLVLNRSRALNALTRSMVQDLARQLMNLEKDPSVKVIILRSQSDVAFCAGGDMRRIRELSLAGEYKEADAFFAGEYALNQQIANCKTPYVSLIDGICMGGGLGLSVHGAYRIVTERAVLAMPETAIGFFPDVGASYFLPRLSGFSGRWLGLTGARLSGEEALALGLATHCVASADLATLVDQLCHSDAPVSSTLAGVASKGTMPSKPANPLRSQIDRWFEGDGLEMIFANLNSDPDPAAQECLSTLRSVSPESLRVTFDLLQQGAGSSLSACLARERRAAETLIRHPDFIEGVRSVLVDKDRAPKWMESDLKL